MGTICTGLPPRSRQVAATTAIFVAALSVGTAVATTADAKPKKPPGVAEYSRCMDGALFGPGAPQHPSQQAVYDAMEKCCTDLDGIFNEQTGDCYLPDGETYKPTQTPSPPPPGATAILPPGGPNLQSVQ